MRKKIVKIKIHIGSDCEGRVKFTAINPNKNKDYILTNNLEQVIEFCESRKLLMDESFNKLVENLLFKSNTGLMIPFESLDENNLLSSCNFYLRENFRNYI